MMFRDRSLLQTLMRWSLRFTIKIYRDKLIIFNQPWIQIICIRVVYCCCWIWMYVHCASGHINNYLTEMSFWTFFTSKWKSPTIILFGAKDLEGKYHSFGVYFGANDRESILYTFPSVYFVLKLLIVYIKHSIILNKVLKPYK